MLTQITSVGSVPSSFAGGRREHSRRSPCAGQPWSPLRFQGRPVGYRRAGGQYHGSVRPLFARLGFRLSWYGQPVSPGDVNLDIDGGSPNFLQT